MTEEKNIAPRYRPKTPAPKKNVPAAMPRPKRRIGKPKGVLEGLALDGVQINEYSIGASPYEAYAYHIGLPDIDSAEGRKNALVQIRNYAEGRGYRTTLIPMDEDNYHHLVICNDSEAMEGEVCGESIVFGFENELEQLRERKTHALKSVGIERLAGKINQKEGNGSIIIPFNAKGLSAKDCYEHVYGPRGEAVDEIKSWMENTFDMSCIGKRTNTETCTEELRFGRAA